MNKRSSVLDKLMANKSAETVAEVQAERPPKKVVATNVGGSALKTSKARVNAPAAKGHIHHGIRNMPQAYRDEFKRMKEAGLVTGTFNDFMVAAIGDAVKKLQRKEKRDARRDNGQA